MARKFKSVEKFYNYLCDHTDSTWTGVVQSDTKTIFQDLCIQISYVDVVKQLLSDVQGAQVIGVQDGMIFVLYEA